MYICSVQSFKILARSEAEQAGLHLAWSKIPEDMFSRDVMMLKILISNILQVSVKTSIFKKVQYAQRKKATVLHLW